MAPEGREIRRYPHTKRRVYLDLTTLVLSALLTILIFPAYTEWPLLLLYYLIFTSLITTIAYLLRIRLFLTKGVEPRKEPLHETEKPRTSWKSFILLFSAALALLLVPLLLAMVLHPHSWFLLIISLTSGLSISDILVYFHGR